MFNEHDHTHDQDISHYRTTQRSHRPNPAYGPMGQWIVARPTRIASVERQLAHARANGYRVSMEIYEAALKRLTETALAEANRQTEIANVPTEPVQNTFDAT